MTSRKVFEPVDRTFRDIKGEEHKDLLLFGGDFAQTLPVVEKGRRADTLQKSFTWEKLKKESHIPIR
jgi:PIF1-like helicase